MTAITKMSMGEARSNDTPISELFRLAALKFVDDDAAANLLEETKSTLLQEIKTRLIAATEDKMSETKAERLAKCDPEYKTHIAKMCAARKDANRRKLQLEYFRMKHSERVMSDANARAERRLT